LFPLIEYENGQITPRKIAQVKPVVEYLKVQGRFKHLIKDEAALAVIQSIADANIKKYGLKTEV
jgi:pyruvate ferredoxin oxidoreductase beta subunit